MNESMISEQPHHPSAFGAFFRGGMSGLISGVVMAVIIAAVSPPLLAGIGIFSAGYVAAVAGSFAHAGVFMMVASTLFGGVMAAKRAVFDAPHQPYNSNTNTMVPVPLPSMAGPAMAPAVAFAEEAPEQTSPTKSWVAKTGRSDDSHSRIQQILADGSLSDKDRASAILASREAANQQANRA